MPRWAARWFWSRRSEGILLGADPDLARPVVAYAKKNFKEVRLKTQGREDVHAGKADQGGDGIRRQRSGGTLRPRAGGRRTRAELRGYRPGKHQGRIATKRASSRSTKSSRPTIRAFTPSATLRAACCWRTRLARGARGGGSNCGPGQRVYRRHHSRGGFYRSGIAWCGLTEAEAKEKGDRGGRLPNFPGPLPVARCRLTAPMA